mmetsp:Transcript_20482/g.29720  ORF Transcript_20482/g.29720 Transcript_20482/m.29720 type:complete len:110 (+) Transcript_20482:472-801(+)
MRVFEFARLFAPATPPGKAMKSNLFPATSSNKASHTTLVFLAQVTVLSFETDASVTSHSPLRRALPVDTASTSSLPSAIGISTDGDIVYDYLLSEIAENDQASRLWRKS